MSISVITLRKFQAKASVSGCCFSSGHNMYRLKLTWRCPSIEAMSARRTHKVPCVQFAFSDDTVLSESIERAANTWFYPSRIRCTILRKTHRRRFTNKWSLEEFKFQEDNKNSRNTLVKMINKCWLHNQSTLSSTRHGSTWAPMLEKHTWSNRGMTRAMTRWLLVDLISILISAFFRVG